MECLEIIKTRKALIRCVCFWTQRAAVVVVLGLVVGWAASPYVIKPPSYAVLMQVKVLQENDRVQDLKLIDHEKRIEKLEKHK